MRTGWQAYCIRTLLHFLCLLLLLVFQTSFFGLFPLRGVTPDLMLIATLSVTLLRGPLAGGAFGFVGGLLADILTGRLIGLGAMILTVIGLVAGLLGQRIYSERLSVMFLFNVASSFVHLTLYGAGAWAFGVHMPILQGVVAMAPWLMVYNGLLALALHPLVRRGYVLLDAVFIVSRVPMSSVQGR